MARTEPDIVARESQLARRVGRLFRFECAGRLARYSSDIERRLQDRRGELIETLIRTDRARRDSQIPISAELQRAAEALWQEIGAARRATDVRLEQLRANLAIALGDGASSGVRNSATGRILGQG